MIKKPSQNILTLVALLTISLTSWVDADPTKQSLMGGTGDHTELAFYLSGEAICATFPDPPSLGSAVDQSDLAITLLIQNTRNKQQTDETFLDKNYSIKLLTDVIDVNFETKFPETFALLKRADHDAYLIDQTLKKKTHRLRPFVQHPALVLPLFEATDFSYPSGHSCGSELQAQLLGLLFPTRREDLLKRARQIADSRVIAGVHYTSDTEAGLHLGDLIFENLTVTDKFHADLQQALASDHLNAR
jgi:acid phosphatase (class A)